MLTYMLFKPRAYSCQARQMLTYNLFKTQSMLLSATSRKSQPDADLHAVQSPEHGVVSNQQVEIATCRLTCCSKPRACSCQQQAGKASQMLTYKLFKTQSMLLSATSRKGQPDADLHSVQNPEHALVSNKQKSQADADLHPVQSPEHAHVSNQQGGTATC